MERNTRLALTALAIVGVYLFGVMTGAVGLPLARAIGGAVLGAHTGRVAMMGQGYTDARGDVYGRGMMGDRWQQDGTAPDADAWGQRVPDGAYPDCPVWDEGSEAPSQDPTLTPGGPRGGPMMPPGTMYR